LCEQYIEGIERELLMGDGREDEKKMQVASGCRMEKHNDEELVKYTIKYNFFS